MTVPAHRPEDDALDRLARGPVDPAPFVATVREALERLRRENQTNADALCLQMGAWMRDASEYIEVTSDHELAQEYTALLARLDQRGKGARR